MTTIDRRTRLAGSAEVMDADRLFGHLAARLAETGGLAGRGVDQLGLSPLGLDVDGTVVHLIVRDGRLLLDDGDGEEGPVVELDAAACSELFQDVTSTFGLVMAGRIRMRRGTSDQFVAWEPALRAAIDGRPPARTARTSKPSTCDRTSISRGFRCRR